MSDILVVMVLGAINVDLVVWGAALPGPGETVVGGTFAEYQGGKGGNQAVAAARALGDAGRVAMIGAVGNDVFGAAARAALEVDGVDVTWVAVDEVQPTGVALIAVDDVGENQISVVPGANATVDGATVTAALDALSPTIVLASLEVPADAVLAAGEWCRAHDVPFVLNPAPAGRETVELATLATYLTPNEGELAALGGLDGLPPDIVIVETRGSEGVRIHERGETRDVPAPAVESVDTTGAGDCLNGALAASLAEGRPLDDAVRRAVAAAALSIAVAGARDGMPGRTTIDAATGA
ncbi:MAG: ribokinase [Actinomycetota bacterium]